MARSLRTSTTTSHPPYLAAEYLLASWASSLLAACRLASCSTSAAFCAWMRASAASSACLHKEKLVVKSASAEWITTHNLLLATQETFKLWTICPVIYCTWGWPSDPVPGPGCTCAGGQCQRARAGPPPPYPLQPREKSRIAGCVSGSDLQIIVLRIQVGMHRIICFLTPVCSGQWSRGQTTVGKIGANLKSNCVGPASQPSNRIVGNGDCLHRA